MPGELPPVAPPDWYYSGMPLAGPDEEIVTLETALNVLHAQADRVTERDTSPLGGVLHVAHLLKSEQGADGQWPDTLNARTGQAVGSGRTIAPVTLFRRLNALLNSTEFEAA
ncbi:MAG TPA: hypothetical protein VFB21_01630, partial [Chthonomonadaceae bacterium]|nr:hypothetical protein [Chthonomonadaceae bacterium]